MNSYYLDLGDIVVFIIDKMIDQAPFLALVPGSVCSQAPMAPTLQLSRLTCQLLSRPGFLLPQSLASAVSSALPLDSCRAQR